MSANKVIGMKLQSSDTRKNCHISLKYYRMIPYVFVPTEVNVSEGTKDLKAVVEVRSRKIFFFIQRRANLQPRKGLSNRIEKEV